jgi:uncharacterized protein YnzC (UPF0291/DUF896 family)
MNPEDQQKLREQFFKFVYSNVLEEETGKIKSIDKIGQNMMIVSFENEKISFLCSPQSIKIEENEQEKT